MEQQNQKVLFRRWNNITKKCYSEDGTAKSKSDVPKMEQKIKKCCSEDGTAKPKSGVLKMEQQNQKVLF